MGLVVRRSGTIHCRSGTISIRNDPELDLELDLERDPELNLERYTVDLENPVSILLDFNGAARNADLECRSGTIYCRSGIDTSSIRNDIDPEVDLEY